VTLPEYYALPRMADSRAAPLLGRERAVMDYDLGALPTGETVALHRKVSPEIMRTIPKDGSRLFAN